jgi:hypothetical protein
MGYETALRKAWEGLEAAGIGPRETVRFFGEELRVEPGKRAVLDSEGRPVKDFTAILVLHYLRRKLAGLPPLTGKWISFKELDGGEQYYPAFRARAIEPLLKKQGAGRDLKVTLEPFEGVPLQVVMWAGDEEFPPEATILFDASIRDILCTEDTAVLAGFAPRHVPGKG